MVSEVVTGVITAFLFVGAVAWLFIMVYWVLGRFGLWKWATYRRLNKRYKDNELNDEMIEWCLDKYDKKWAFKDIRRFSKYEKNRGEILYTYLMFSKIPKAELNAMIERRLQNEQNRGTKKEARKPLPAFPSFD